MEVERERLRLRKQKTRQATDPADEQRPLLGSLATIGILGQEGLLRRHMQAREQAQGLVAAEVVDVAAAFLVEDLEGARELELPIGWSKYDWVTAAVRRCALLLREAVEEDCPQALVPPLEWSGRTW